MKKVTVAREIKKGSKVEYFNRDVDGWVPATVMTVGDEKDGRKVYDVELANGSWKWGYADQIR